jgi:hypothetical protein
MSKILRAVLASATILFYTFTHLSPAKAQRVEFGLSAGVANYVGDLAPTMVMSETKPMAGFFGRYILSSSFAWVASASFTTLSGADANFSVNKQRNLSFKTNISEYATVLEFNYLKFGKGILDKKFTSYLYGGIGLLAFNPTAEFNGQTYDLRPFRTEGVNYGTTTVVLPFGMGIKWRFNKHFSFESNFGFRRTYTDYLDDVSFRYVDFAQQQQTTGTTGAILSDRSAELNNGEPMFKQGHRRGNADFRDWYAAFNISLTYRIYGRQKCSRFY